MLGFHHIASDGWSQHLYGDSFSKAIRNVVVAAPRAFVSLDYARRQRAWLASPDAQSHLDWWMRRLRNISVEPPRLPVRLATGARPSAGMFRVQIRLGPSVHAAAHAVAREFRSPLLAVTFVPFARVIARRTGRQLVAAQSMVGGRSLPGGYAATGAFYNSVVLSQKLAPGENATAQLHAARTCVFDVLRHQEVPACLVARAATARGLRQSPETIPLTFNLIRHALAGFRIPGVRMREVDLAKLTVIETTAEIVETRRLKRGVDSPLTLIVNELAREFCVSLDCANSFEEKDAEEFLVEYVRELKVFCAELGHDSQRARETVIGGIYDNLTLPGSPT
jgi:hypothetical protein